LTTWLVVGAHQAHCLANKTDGTLWSWGNDYNGQLGRNTQNVYRSSPVQVGALTAWVGVSRGSTSLASAALYGVV